MRKLILTTSLILLILVSFLTGTLAIYSKTIEIDTPASVIAKDFIFVADGTESFRSDVKIAPTETVTFQFGVRNYEGTAVSDTAMRYELLINVGPSPGKTAIGPLIVRVKDEWDHILNSVTCTGVLNVSNVFPISGVGQRHAYKIEFFWPSTTNDIDFEGDAFSTQINVTATATQMTENVYLVQDSMIRMGTGGFSGLMQQYSGSYTNIVIPATVKGQTATGIYQDAFSGKNLTFVSFAPDCIITRIHARAFDNNNLREISLPATVNRIDYGAFRGNPNLAKVTIGDNVYLEGNVFLNNNKFRDAYNNTYGKSAGTYIYIAGEWIKQ